MTSYLVLELSGREGIKGLPNDVWEELHKFLVSVTSLDVSHTTY